MAHGMRKTLGKALCALVAACIAAPFLGASLSTAAYASPDDTGTPMDRSRSSSSSSANVIDLQDVLDSEKLENDGFPVDDNVKIIDVTQGDSIDESVFQDGSSGSIKAGVADVTILPEAYFLTNEGFVTPVKLQSPWGDCWAFAIASAVESSILKKASEIQAVAGAMAVEEAAEVASEASSDGSVAGIPGGVDVKTDGGVTYIDLRNVEYTGHDAPKLLGLNESVDVSERALAWLAHEVQTEESAGDQSGEGFYLVDPSSYMNQLAEGSFEMIECQLVSRQSLLSEEDVPYAYNGYEGSPEWFSTGSWDGASDDARTRDWSIPSDIRVNTEIGWVVNEVYKLASPAVTVVNSNGSSTYVSYDPSATTSMKETIMKVGAVAVAIEAESSIPADVSSGNFVNASPSADFTYTTWSQYDADDVLEYNHAVSVVGWDDTYSASNFAGTSSGMPPGDGAWLCKNNWGSDALYSKLGASGEATHWGISADSSTGLAAASGSEGGAGTEASGFFWLSYYDHSIHTPVAFGVTPVSEDFENIYQYDYLGSAEFSKPATYEEDIWVANMFEADKTELIQAVSAQTFATRDEVQAKIYVIPACVDVSGMTPDEVFENATEVAEFSDVFKTAGFHTIELPDPVLVREGDHFIIAEMVKAVGYHTDGSAYSGSYLNLEMSFLEQPDGMDQVSMSKVVANPGETFVNLPAGISNWADTTEYAEWYSDSGGASAHDSGIAFGNALAKAYTGDTTMSKIGQVYETVQLR